jgi:UDP-N-acetylmuramoyl-tripeptide--D-alanyl-D-alanine ligase
VIGFALMLFMLIGFVTFAARRLLTYLHLFQQEEYDGRRFLRWLVESGAWDRRLSLALVGLFVLQAAIGPLWILAFYLSPLLSPLLLGLAFLAAAWCEGDPRKTAKKPLAMTARAKRIFGIGLALATALGLVLMPVEGFFLDRLGAAIKLGSFLPIAVLLAWSCLVWIVAVQLIPLLLVAANLLLAPFEARVQRRYWSEAHEKLGRLKPVVIGITGSYGKTSVKHILGHVLETAAPTLITPGSVNTAMGIARVIRERLQPHHRWFVVEMGAYGIGSIERLCALTPPGLGIITAIGKAHYERFKTLDAVSHAKFELAEAARDNGGNVIVAADVLEFAWPRQFAERHADIVVTVGDDPEAALAIRALRQDMDGIVAEITWRGADYRLQAPLFGLHQGRNIALAFAAACTLGLAPEDVVASLKSTPQIAHRLEVKRQHGGTIVIDDAYNSNPVGFASALALLDCLRPADGRRILVTPGMAELGSEHVAEHARIGRLAAEHVDVLVAVAPHRTAALVEAFHEAAPQRDVVACPTFAEARQWLDRHLGGDDVVLIENDLPDILERKLRL